MDIAVGSWMVVTGKGLAKVVGIDTDGSVRLYNRGLDQGWVCPADRLHDGLRALCDRPTATATLVAAIARDAGELDEGDRRVLYSQAWRSSSFERYVEAARVAVVHGDRGDRAADRILTALGAEIALSADLDIGGVCALLPHVLGGGLAVDDLFEVGPAPEATEEQGALGDAALDAKLTAAGFPRLERHHSEAWELARALEHEPAFAELALRGWVTSFDAEDFHDADDYRQAISGLLRAGGCHGNVEASVTDEAIRIVVNVDGREAVARARHSGSGSGWADVKLIVKAARQALGKAVTVRVLEDDQRVVLAAIPAAAPNHA